MNRATQFVLIVCVLVTSAQAQRKNQSEVPNDSETKVSVRISATKTRLQPGESVGLHVEILNQGPKGVFVFKEIDGPDNALSKLDLFLHYHGHVYRPGVVTIADCFCSGRGPDSPPLAIELSKFWIALPPGHFYGGEVIMHASLFERLRVPGRYQVQGKYTSRGFLTQDINNPLLGYADELKQLPYHSWTGEVETNSIWIEVAKPRNRKEQNP
jgi:hypothetical protein